MDSDSDVEIIGEVRVSNEERSDDDEAMSTAAYGDGLMQDTSRAIISKNIHDSLLHNNNQSMTEKDLQLRADGFATSRMNKLARYSKEAIPKGSFSRKCISAEEIVEQTMPTPYVPPSQRYQFTNTRFYGKINLFNDYGDDSKSPKFRKIMKNELRTPRRDQPLDICCDCTDGCKDKSTCPCRRYSVHVQLTANGIELEEPVDEFDLHCMHAYACGDKCRCRIGGCGNRIEWVEKENEFEVLRRNPKMGFELRSLRSYEPGETVIEFVGEVVEDTEIE
ncbi:hypothetical protein PMAYCL1PPCAC_21915, partial [Pristionchus mayeri]